MNNIELEGHIIGDGCPPFIIAEMSGNHNHSLERALSIVESAASAGVQGLKIQTYNADTMTLNIDEGEFRIEDKNSLWGGNSLYKLYDQAHTPWEWHKPIFDLARQRGLVAFSTPFDKTSVDFLEDLSVPLYKIASFENTDIPLIRYVASTGKPMIISTGMASEEELAETVDEAKAAGCKQLVLLKCTSAYPCNASQANLVTIQHMKNKFGCLVGLSDHTLGIGVAVAASAIGAVVVEKHFTLSRADGGVDSAFSMEPLEMKMLVQECVNACNAIGAVTYGPTETESGSLVFRRSLYIVEDMNAGDHFNDSNVRAIRPGYGLPPKYLYALMGKTVTRNVKKGTALAWDLIKESF
jgi:pseudaminic acid synthase